MEVKSISDCLNRVDNMIFEKSLKCKVKGDLEDIRNHIERKRVHIFTRVAVLAVLSQINHIIERFYSGDNEEDLDKQYKILRRRLLDWYEVINTEPEFNNQQ